MARGYGYRVYLQPVLPQFINLASVLTNQEARTAIGVGGFMDITTLAPQNAIITERGLANGQTFYLTLNETATPITNAALTSNVVTLTIGTHTRLVGQRVAVRNLPAPFASCNGNFVISAVASTTINYALTGANITSGVVAAGTASMGTDLKLDGTDPPFRLLGIEDGPYSGESDTEETPTWDDEAGGFKRSEATAKTADIAFAGLSNYTDAGYNILQLCESGNVSRSLYAKLVRIGPAGFNECRFGYGRFDSMSESNAAGTTVKWTAPFNFDGPAGLVRHQ
jgi:hypothetical protein